MKREETFADVFPGTIGTVPPTAQETIAAFHGDVGAPVLRASPPTQQFGNFQVLLDFFKQLAQPQLMQPGMQFDVTFERQTNAAPGSGVILSQNMLVWAQQNTTQVAAQQVAEQQLTKWWNPRGSSTGAQPPKPQWWPSGMQYPLPANWCVRARIIVSRRFEVWSQIKCLTIPGGSVVIGKPTQKFGVGSPDQTAQETIAAWHAGQLGAATPMRAGSVRATVPDMVYVKIVVTTGQKSASSVGLIPRGAYTILHAALVDVRRTAQNRQAGDLQFFEILSDSAFGTTTPAFPAWYISLKTLNSILSRVGMPTIGWFA